MTRRSGLEALAIGCLGAAFLLVCIVVLRSFVAGESEDRFEPQQQGQAEDSGPAPRRVERGDGATAAATLAPDRGSAPSPEAGVLRVGVVGSQTGSWRLLYLPRGSITAAERTRLLIVEARLETLLEERGEALEVASATDRVALPARSEGYLLMALADGARSRPREFEFDWRGGGALPAVIDLELEPAVVIEVLVLDSDGHPAPGVPLIERRKEPGAGALSFVVSDSQGIARFLIPAQSATEDARRDRIVEFAGPAREPPSIPFPAAAERAVLRLGPTGRVLVDLRDEAGLVLGEVVGGTLWTPVQEGSGRVGPSWSRCSVSGRIHFDWVGLDLDLGIGARPLDDSREPVNLHFPGPRAAGEQVQVELAFGEALPVVQGRLVDAEGRLLCAASLRIRARSIPDGADWGFGEIVVTDEMGDFVQTLGWLPAGTPFELEMRVELVADRAYGPDAPRAFLRRENGLSAGRNDLGVVVCVAALPAAGGRIVDERGRPLAGLTIELVELEEAGDERRFRALHPRAKTDEDGRFSISAALAGPFRLRIVGAEDFLTERLNSGAIHLDLTVPASAE